MWHGQPIKIICSFFFVASTIKDLCLPTFTDVLSTPNAMQLLQGISYLVIAESMEQNIPADVEDLLRHISRNFVTTLCVDLCQKYAQSLDSSFPDFGHCFHQ